MITVEELKKCKKASSELIKAIEEYLKENFPDKYDCPDLEDDFQFEFNNVSYGILETEDDGWSDEGKYAYSCKTYQLVSFDKNIKGYDTDESIIDKFDLFISQSASRSGSYFTDYYYQYCEPIIQIATLEHIPEKVIPEHDEVRFNSTKEE